MSRTRRKRDCPKRYLWWSSEEDFERYREAFLAEVKKPKKPSLPTIPYRYIGSMYLWAMPEVHEKAKKAWDEYHAEYRKWSNSEQYRTWQLASYYQRYNLGKHTFKEYVEARCAWMYSDSGFRTREAPGRSWRNLYLTRWTRARHRSVLHKVYRADLDDIPDIYLEEANVGKWYYYR